MIKKIVIVAVIGAAAWYGFSFIQKGNVKENYITHKLSRGNITEMVSASGTINPISSIDVGTQVSGRIQKVEDRRLDDTVGNAWKEEDK
jgi:HlyD family secretion protein